MNATTMLLAGTALLVCAPAIAQQAQPTAQPAQPAQPSQPAQQAEPAAGDFSQDEGDTIVVTGTKLPGSVIGDIPPENVLDAGDVRATGATDINELLDAIAPQIGSSRGRGGGRPVMLLNGQRISGFRELRDIPTEAISRVEILPEEVALKYGYAADQRVVNFVLRPRFQSTTAQLGTRTATDGGYLAGTADWTRLAIGEKSRTSVNLHAQRNGMLLESERNVLLEQAPGPGTPDPRSARSLVGSSSDLRGAVTVNRHVGAVGATGNIELEHRTGKSLIGLGDTLIVPLARDTANDSAHAGTVLSSNLGKWYWSVTGNADAAHDLTWTDRNSAYIRDRTESTRLSGDVDAVANGSLFRLPAGQAGTTLKVGADVFRLDSERRRRAVSASSSLGRSSGMASANLDLPVSRRDSGFGGLGNLTLNANAQVEQLSDFGTLTTIGGGANWSPAKRMSLIASWTREEGAPSVQQLGDPILETPGTRIFDFTTGQTVLATAITGGNRSLRADRRNVFKLGGNWTPFPKLELVVRGEYVRTHTDRPISTFPGPSAELEAAFPDRFVRDSAGELVSIDLRPVNYDSARQDTLRLGFDFSKPLRSAPPSATAIAAFRQRAGAAVAERGRQGTDQAPAASGNPAPPAGREGTPPPAVGPGGRFSFGGPGRRNGGRLMFSLTDNVTLIDQVSIRPGLPKLDYLRGDAAGQAGGRPRHQVEARAGYFNNGIGARLSADWRSATSVTSAGGDQLHFAPLATFNLNLFANLGQRFDLVARHPWLRGASVRVGIDNLFDSKPSVRNAAGVVPFGYQPDLLDPLGRTVSITFRKLFLPPPAFFRRSGAGGGPGG